MRPKGVRLYFLSILRFLSGVFRSIYQASRYGIKRGYIHRQHVILHDDRGYGEEFQKEVYQKANELMIQFGWNSIIDLGCGSGYKLVKYLGDFNTLGVDIDPVLSLAKKNFPNSKWLFAHEFYLKPHTADLVLCADVIEHVEHPEVFLNSLFAIPNWKCIMISTPERNIKRGMFHYGPPPNPGHWREWSKKELYKFVSKRHIVYSQEITNRKQGTQLIICLHPDQRISVD